jgi:hypothetical protein
VGGCFGGLPLVRVHFLFSADLLRLLSEVCGECLLEHALALLLLVTRARVLVPEASAAIMLRVFLIAGESEELLHEPVVGLPSSELVEGFTG